MSPIPWVRPNWSSLDRCGSLTCDNTPMTGSGPIDHPGGDKGRGASTFRAQYQDCSTIERDALLEYANSSIALYLYGNLNYLEADNMSSLIDAVFHHAGTFNKWCTNSFKLDCVMRCFICVLKTNASNIDSIHISGIAKLLLPLMVQTERSELLARQIKRLGPEI